MKTLISWISAFGIFAMLLAQLIYDIKDFTKLSEPLCILVTYMGIIVKLLVFHYRKNEFLKITNSLRDPIFLSYPEDLDHYMAKSIKQSVVLINIYRVVGVTIMIGCTIYPILDNKPLPIPFPYDLGKFTIPVYCLLVIGGSFSTLNNICFDVTCTSLMGVVAAQLDILTEKITRLEEDDGVIYDPVIFKHVSRTINKKLKDCVKHHLAIIK
ncbi:hypothetical protein ILUMI_02068 [Ignelater luminosus]|uniref:Uncharacterized protein n=1 Tax=Ignelater luminosus TaxID=2038154 RepID=A0A8K0DD94_IGNLU|nr:hypothetical protein ILUMI_02068 [Ignelater luminosus]